MDEPPPDTQPAGALVPLPSQDGPAGRRSVGETVRPAARGEPVRRLLRGALDELDLLGDRIAAALGLRGS